MLSTVAVMQEELKNHRLGHTSSQSEAQSDHVSSWLRKQFGSGRWCHRTDLQKAQGQSAQTFQEQRPEFKDFQISF